MARKISSSQFKSKMRQIERQIEQKQRRIISDYNREVRKYNNNVKRAVNAYNSAVRKHNENVRRNRQIIQRELYKLNTTSISTYHSAYFASVSKMQNIHNAVAAAYDNKENVTPKQNEILDIIDREQANSLIVANAILTEEQSQDNFEDVEIENKLARVSVDLMNRWKGAVYALSPQNPDAARHFCTSARELFTDFIEAKAPDEDVFATNPAAEKTDRGNPTRREKLKYMLRSVSLEECVIDFAEEDINNILELFSVLSKATHGTAGSYDYGKLIQVKNRVTQGINFLCEISA